MRGTFEYSSKSLWKTRQTHWNLFGKLLGNVKLLITAWLSFCCHQNTRPSNYHKKSQKLMLRLEKLTNASQAPLHSYHLPVFWNVKMRTKKPLLRERMAPQCGISKTRERQNSKLQNDLMLWFTGSWVAAGKDRGISAGKYPIYTITKLRVTDSHT